MKLGTLMSLLSLTFCERTPLPAQTLAVLQLAASYEVCEELGSALDFRTIQKTSDPRLCRPRARATRTRPQSKRAGAVTEP